MHLDVHWHKATRPHDVKTQVELLFRNALLEYFNGVEVAKRAHDAYVAAPHKQFHSWARGWYHANRAVKRVITAEELGHTTFSVEFNT